MYLLLVLSWNVIDKNLLQVNFNYAFFSFLINDCTISFDGKSSKYGMQVSPYVLIDYHIVYFFLHIVMYVLVQPSNQVLIFDALYFFFANKVVIRNFIWNLSFSLLR